jgi:uncharacterized protein YndB with AHSA1/START domain
VDCELRLTRRYAAPPAEVWRALTEPESMARWLAPPPGVEVRTVEPERVLELDWQPPGERPSVVRVELTADGNGTKLVLDHRSVQAELGMRYARMWTQRLERLRRRLDGGAKGAEAPARPAPERG